MDPEQTTPTTETPDATPPTPPAQPETPAEPETDWKAEAEKWKGLARKHEERRQVDGWLSPDDARKLSEERDQLRTATADTDALKLDAAQNLAVAKLEGRLARAGLSEADIEALAGAVDPTRLLADGAPSAEAITKVATALTRTAGVSTPDPDQGAGRNSGPTSPAFNDLIRAARGVA
ncbi:hypothetical protein [Actinomycetospora sp. CA-053990]|uniref:hypothetical protein n=1 Tax=Actinomycetospora sp. CA-053990 TaxID=3239891 RepID=UPI003D8EBA4D